VQLVRADAGERHACAVGGATVAIGLLVALLCLAAAATATAAPRLKRVTYRGYTLRVPAGWPVYRLGANSTVCVRFNRHAVYLGRPSTRQRCPATSLGRTEAILVAPAGAPGSALPSGGAVAQRRVAQLEVTATWNRDPGLVRRAVGGKLAPPPKPRPPAPAIARTALARPAARPHQAGEVYNGLGFDACSAPSTNAMIAWGASPYRALGVYIGGTNMACSQTNLTSAWVAQEWAAGWHLIPTYVGLQAPTNSCGCAAMSTNTTTAAAEGAAAAQDAVTHAQAVGIGAGNPIYDDMENYSRTSTNTAAVLAFVSAWTAQLHAEGYVSGVYSSSDSGMVDLSSQYGTTYVEPDDIWVANWNGSETTTDPNVPATDWANGQRLHQYSGGHNATYGGYTINIDGDYLDGATAFGAGVAPPPSLQVAPAGNGSIQVSASWQGGIGLSRWLILGGMQPTGLSFVSANPVKGAVTTINEGSEYPYYQAEALGSSGQLLATSSVVTTAPHLAIYGRSVFVPASGPVGVPAGCFTGALCRAAVALYVGTKRIAHSGREYLGGTGGLLFVTLSGPDRRLLAAARGHRLPVTVQATDFSGASAKTSMNLVPFKTIGRGPHRTSTDAPTLRLIGTSDYLYRGVSGGILADCSGPSPCLVKTSINVGPTTIASTGQEFIGANSAGYLTFRLTPAGRQLLAKAPGNMLGARVTLTDATGTAHGSIVLSTFY
jgi:Rv2525c-like, glycoside hydrolase-like domain